MSEWKPCPDFDLAPLSEFEPRMFDWDKKDKDLKDVYAFIITLALIYNDFKDLTWWSKQLDGCPPESQEINPYLGQFNGMKMHISRLIVGLYDEFLKLLKENKEVLTSKTLKEILGQISSKDRKDWQKLVDQSADKELLRVLEDLRGNGVYHYYNIKGIFSGYSNYFRNNKSPLAEKAWYSLGKTILSTRFYFADAAAQGYAVKFDDRKIQYLLMEINTSLKTIVGAAIGYFQSKK